MSPIPQRIFCCKAAGLDPLQASTKLHQDPNRDLHESLLRSFLAFAIRQEILADLHEEEIAREIGEATRILANLGILEKSASSVLSPTATPPEPKNPVPQIIPMFTQEALKGNPLGPAVPYVFHLVSRTNFGLVYSHRYFACPWELSQDWIEMSLIHWFAEGEPFKMKAHKWDVRCQTDKRFFRLTLRPNLRLRPVDQVPVPGPELAPAAHAHVAEECPEDWALKSIPDAPIVGVHQVAEAQSSGVEEALYSELLGLIQGHGRYEMHEGMRGVVGC